MIVEARDTLPGPGKIHCDQTPVNANWRLAHHRKRPAWTWNPNKVRLYRSPEQLGGLTIAGPRLRAQLAQERPLNACDLEYLYTNRHHIPEEWNELGLRIAFWGSFFWDEDEKQKGLLVRLIYKLHGRWEFGYHWVDWEWGPNDVAAVFVS